MNKKSIIQSVAMVLIVAALMLIWQNKRVFTGEHDYYAYYHNIQGLQQSSPVMINGVRVGKIRDLDLNGSGRVKVTVSLKKQIELTEGTMAFLAASGITGEKIIELRLGAGPGILPDEAVLPSRYDSSVMSATVRVTPIVELSKRILRTTDSTLQSFTDLFRSGILTSTTHRIISVDKDSRGFAAAAVSLNQSTTGLCRSMKSTDSSVKNIAAGNADRTRSIANAQKQSAELAKTSIPDNFKKLQQSFSSLKTTLTKAGENSLINDPSAYQGLALSADTFHQDMSQMYKDPQGFTLFPKKKKK
jgi:phospholipid/cholesterol/gamma-HCH transport system substrate-binding protein